MMDARMYKPEMLQELRRFQREAAELLKIDEKEKSKLVDGLDN
jgi:hypothetical protein